MKNTALIDKLSIAFGIVMGLFYISAGLFFYFSNVFRFSQDYHKIIVCSLIVVYGFFRFYKVYQKSSDKNQKQEENDED